MSGQTLNDRLTAAKHTLAGQGLARIVCKATTEEVIGPKKKHLDHLTHCTNEPNVSIPQLANLLIERTQHSSWVVVFKALITVHHLMCYGNDRFTQYLASSNCTFQLGSFVDKCGVQGYDMSTFIRRYAKYLNEKAIAYRTVAFDFCKCKRGKDDGILRTMNIEKLLKTLPILQNQLDALLEFDCSSNDLTNGVVNSCFMLLFRDLIRLFACYNDGIINLLEKYFEMNKKHARDALDIYKKFLIRMDRVAEFLKVAEIVGIDKGEIPDLTKAPSSLLEALEQHLATLEGRKGSTTSASAVATRATNLRNAVSALSHTSNAFGSADENASMPSQEVNGIKVDESVRKAVEEEAEIMNQLKERRMKEVASGEALSPPSAISKTNPFLASPAEPPQTSTQGILDLFSSTTSPSGAVSDDTNALNAKNDLLSLNNNPFADSLFSSQGQDDTKQSQQDQSPFQAFAMNGFSANTSSAFATDASFAAAFGDSPTAASETAAALSPSSAPTTTPVATGNISTVKLNLPVLEPFGGRSTSPSPTTDLMRGAGTTPILANPPEGLFGETMESAEEVPSSTTATVAKDDSSNFIWGSDSTGSGRAEEQAKTIENDPFGTPFEPQSSAAQQPPTAVVPPLSVQSSSTTTESSAKSVTADLFGLDSTDFGDFGGPPTSAQPCAPPPSPFGGLDITSLGQGQDLRTQAMVNASNMPTGGMFPSQIPTAASGLDNLNFALQKAMQGPSAVSPTSFAPSVVPPGGMGFPGHMFSPMGTCLPSTGTVPQVPSSVPLAQLDNFGSGIAGTPSVRTSSTPGYGTPPSGLSSPARSVASVGATTGGFDAFGDTLQPQMSTGVKPSTGSDKPSGSLIKGDLDSTLANLASNLDINGPKQSLKKGGGHQWGSPKPVTKTAGAPVSGWAGPPTGMAPAPGVGAPTNMAWSASPQHGFQPQVGPVAGQWAGGVVPGAFPQQAAPTGVIPPQPYMVGGMRPVASAQMTGMQMPVNMGMPAQQGMMSQQAMYAGFTPQMPVAPQTAVTMPSQQAAPAVNDPFGAL